MEPSGSQKSRGIFEAPCWMGPIGSSGPTGPRAGTARGGKQLEAQLPAADGGPRFPLALDFGVTGVCSGMFKREVLRSLDLGSKQNPDQ